jgi:hypothetical protein
VAIPDPDLCPFSSSEVLLSVCRASTMQRYQAMVVVMDGEEKRSGTLVVIKGFR